MWTLGLAQVLGCLKNLHLSKEAPIWQNDGKPPQTLSVKSACWGASLKHLYPNTSSMGSNLSKLLIYMQLQGYDLDGTTEMWRSGSCDCIGDIIVGVSCRPPDEEEPVAFYRQKQAHICRPWSSWRTLGTLISAEGTAQQGISNPEVPGKHL